MNKNDIEAIEALKKNVFMNFHSDTGVNNKAGFKIYFKEARKQKAAGLSALFVTREVERFLKEGNTFGAMLLMQFSFIWNLEFPEYKTLSVGQVDMILRKHYA